MKLLDRLDELAVSAPGRAAVVFGRGRTRQVVSYGELVAEARNLAERLARADAQGATFVAAARGGPLIIGLLACLWAGVPGALIDLQQPARRTQSILEQAPRALVLTDAAGALHLGRVNTPPSLRLMPLLEPARAGTSAATARARAPLPSDAPAIVLFTSGSTGVPKGVVIGRTDLDQRLAVEGDWFGLTPDDRILGVLPLTFDVGLTQCLGTLYAGGTHVLGDSWLPADLVSRIDEENVTGLALAPMVWRQLLAAKQAAAVWAALNRLRYVTLSGGSLSRPELEHLRAHLTTARFVRTYGQTEMFRIAALDVRAHPEKLDSVGPAYPGVRFEVRRLDGAVAAPGEVGEVFAGGLGRMLGYWGEASGAVATDARLVATADWGSVDEDGFLYLKGRKDEMVKILDRRVFPAEIASLCRAALTDPSIEVVVLPRTEPMVVAFTTAALSESDRAVKILLMRRELGNLLAPRSLLTIEQMPATLSGKVDYVALRAHAEAALAADTARDT